MAERGQLERAGRGHDRTSERRRRRQSIHVSLATAFLTASACGGGRVTAADSVQPNLTLQPCRGTSPFPAAPGAASHPPHSTPRPSSESSNGTKAIRWPIRAEGCSPGAARVQGPRGEARRVGPSCTAMPRPRPARAGANTSISEAVVRARRVARGRTGLKMAPSRARWGPWGAGSSTVEREA